MMTALTSFAQLDPVTQKKNKIDPEPLKKGTISISSVPNGCFIKINGESVGTTPLKIKKEKGYYKITFDAAGYESQTKNVNVIAGKTINCKVKLEEIKLTKKDSLFLLADELLGMRSYYADDFTLNEEGQNIVSFQKNTSKYVQNIKNIYESSVSKEKGDKMTVEQLKAIITNNVIRMQNNSDLESACTTKAMSIVSNLQKTESKVKLSIEFTYSTLFRLATLSKEQPLTQEKTNKIVELIGQVKLADAAGIIDDSLNEEKIIERYMLFVRFLKDFYNAGNMRLEELKKESVN
jgi:hypothetical protein